MIAGRIPGDGYPEAGMRCGRLYPDGIYRTYL